jgi:hypothetical protein
MKIYVAHPVGIDFKKELYKPIRQSSLNQEHTFLLPHEASDGSFNSKEYLRDEADLLIAEVSLSATGLGIELGWADVYKVPIICIYKTGSKLAGSLKVVSHNFIEYSNSDELIAGIQKVISQM